LNSHKDNGLFDLIPSKNRIIFFQEITKNDIEIAKEYQCNYIGNNSNVGILHAFVELVKKCDTEYFIFCENDWNLIECKKTTELILLDCIEIFKNDKADIVRLRHRKTPGVPLYSRPINVEEWIAQDVSRFPYKLESLSWLSFPEKIYKNLLHEYEVNYKWYTTNLEHQQWSNNIFIGSTEYLRNNILPLINFLKNEDTDKHLDLENILINYNLHIGKNEELDNAIFNYKKIRISGGEGLFTHKDKV